MVGVKVKGNRIEVGDWIILILPVAEDDLTFLLKNKLDERHWHFNTLEEAWEKVNERV